MIMMKTRPWLTAAAILWLAASCIVSDQFTTLTIQPDGSADWLRFQSNIRSTEKGDKGAEELKRFVEEFEARRDPDCVRIRESGGEILEARWLRRQEPYATVVTARLPSATALQDFCTIKNEKSEEVVRARFAPDGQRRRLTLSIRVPKDDQPAAAARPTESQRRQEQADGISETRVAVSGGQIVACHGFTVAGDKRSALLDPAAIQDLLQAGEGQGEFFLEWEISGK